MSSCGGRVIVIVVGVSVEKSLRIEYFLAWEGGIGCGFCGTLGTSRVGVGDSAMSGCGEHIIMIVVGVQFEKSLRIKQFLP